jgi:predicted helicase
VPGRASQLARNFFGFEILVGPYAVSHLRLTQKIRAAGGNLLDGRLQVYLADTLESPNAQAAGLVTLMGRRLVEERRRAREVKANQRILVCFGNPPYDRQQIDPDDPDTQRKGGWVRFGDREQARVGEAALHPILEDFMAPVRAVGAGVHLKNLYNDYVYFWRWALWKLFEHQAGGGIVSFITAASYLAGPGFIGMREVMRRTFDELWIINLEGDNQGPRRTENVFAIQTPVAIAVGVRGEAPDPAQPAPVHYVRVEGTRDEKLAWLRAIERFDQIEWQDCPNGWSDPFLPVGIGIYHTLPLLTDIFPWHHSGSQFKRTWPIGVTEETVQERWNGLLRAPANQRARLFVETRDRTVGQTFDNGLPGSNSVSINTARLNEDATRVMRYGHRSLCRAWAAFDTRVGDFLRPEIWQTVSPHQVFLTSLLSHPIGVGPSATVTSLMPDLHHYRGSFGGADAIPLYRDPGGVEPNLARAVLGAIRVVLGREVSAEDIFSYVYAVLASPQYVERFWKELIRPGPRIPITRDRELFQRVVAIGRRLIWLHTYGERMVPAGAVRGDVPQGAARSLAPVSDRPAGYPEEFGYRPVEREI